jgi:hypothetical protein
VEVEDILFDLLVATMKENKIDKIQYKKASTKYIKENSLCPLKF